MGVFRRALGRCCSPSLFTTICAGKRTSLSNNPSPPFGDVYRIGSAEDMVTILHREGGLAWQTHPRTKGSAGFPDANKDQFFTRDAAWLGGGFKAMPSDYSTPRLGERALNLLDDMNNWGQRKFLIGEVDVFKINHTHELYGHMNINWTKPATRYSVA